MKVKIKLRIYVMAVVQQEILILLDIVEFYFDIACVLKHVWILFKLLLCLHMWLNTVRYCQLLLDLPWYGYDIVSEKC